MADPKFIPTSVDAGAAFKPASRMPPVLTIQVKPDMVTKIVENLEALKGRTDDSEIKKSGSTYSFIDKRTGQPLAELDSEAGKLSMYKNPKDMAARIDSAFISEKTITNFIQECDGKKDKDQRILPTPAPAAAAVASLT